MLRHHKHEIDCTKYIYIYIYVYAYIYIYGMFEFLFLTWGAARIVLGGVASWAPWTLMGLALMGPPGLSWARP